MPWRWPFIPKAVSKMDSRGGFEGHSAAEFGLGIGDAVCFVVLLIPLCSGLQTVHLFRRLGEERGGWGGAPRWWWAAWVSFGMVVVDLFMLVFW
jgi:hypothetical protein